MVEFWLPMGFVAPQGIAARARQVEADGWDGLKVFDSQCLFGDPFVMAAAAAGATTTLRLSLSTSNPVTRHPSVSAAAIASVAAIAGPRVHYGIGRGDSALAYVGGAPAPVAMFEAYVTAVRRYLHGMPVAFDDLDRWRLTASVDAIHLGNAPRESSLHWLDPAAPPVPIELYATGPRVLAVGGRCADRVALGLGGDVARLRWAMETARAARAEAGLDPSTLSFSAIVPVGVADDLDRARRSVGNMVASEARFTVINGSVAGPVTDGQRKVYEAIGAAYDMEQHGGQGAQVRALTDEFVDEFAVVGPPSRCTERIVELVEPGIDAVMLSPPVGDVGEGLGDQDVRSGYELLVEQVLPAARCALGAR